MPQMTKDAQKWLVMILAVLVVAAGFMLWMSRREVPDNEAVFAAIVNRVDTDHDGRISREEWKRYGGNDAVFNAYDFNGDGFLDVSEFQASFYGTDPKPL